MHIVNKDKRQREILKSYRNVKDAFGISVKNMPHKMMALSNQLDYIKQVSSEHAMDYLTVIEIIFVKERYLELCTSLFKSRVLKAAGGNVNLGEQGYLLYFHITVSRTEADT